MHTSEQARGRSCITTPVRAPSARNVAPAPHPPSLHDALLSYAAPAAHAARHRRCAWGMLTRPRRSSGEPVIALARSRALTTRAGRQPRALTSHFCCCAHSAPGGASPRSYTVSRLRLRLGTVSAAAARSQGRGAGQGVAQTAASPKRLATQARKACLTAAHMRGSLLLEYTRHWRSCRGALSAECTCMAPRGMQQALHASLMFGRAEVTHRMFPCWQARRCVLARQTHVETEGGSRRGRVCERGGALSARAWCTCENMALTARARMGNFTSDSAWSKKDTCAAAALKRAPC